MSKRLLVDTGVWISYFGDRPIELQTRIQRAREIINYCSQNDDIYLFYPPYVEQELINPSFKDRNKNMEILLTIATKLPGHIGNDTWDKIDKITWEDIGSKFNNSEEINIVNKLQEKLPDKKKGNKEKSNRVDRNIFLTARMQRIDILLHENPNDFNKLKNEEIKLIDLTSIQTLEDFIKKIS